jgi:hypothetical protein
VPPFVLDPSITIFQIGVVDHVVVRLPITHPPDAPVLSAVCENVIVGVTLVYGLKVTMWVVVFASNPTFAVSVRLEVM